MGNAVIKIDTGFVGAVHEVDTDLTMEEWDSLPDKEKEGWLQDVLNDLCHTYVVDEDNDDEEW